MNAFAFSSLVVVALAVVSTLPGCGGGGLATVPVSGAITFDGGPPPEVGTISFTPLDVAEGLPRRPAVARFDAEGKFEVTSFQPGDGLLPGTYLAEVKCERGGGGELVDMRNPKADPSYVAKSYKPEQFVVEMDGDPIEAHFDVPLKKR